MRFAAGDIVYAYKKAPSSRRRLRPREPDKQPVLRLTPWWHTDRDGNAWVCVLPLPQGLMETRLSPHDVWWITVDNVVSFKEKVDPDVLEVVRRVLEGEDVRYPWIDLDDEEADPAREYPTVREALADGG